MSVTETPGSGAMQGALWGAAADDWAALSEPQFSRLFDAVLADERFAPGARVLDVGCGSGLFAQLASARGSQVTGIDASEPLLAIARQRTPGAVFHHGEMEALPFAGESFDVVAGLNSFQYAADPRHALAEARRVARPGAAVFVATWGRPEDCEAAAYLTALKPLLPSSPLRRGGPFALSHETALRSLVASAGLEPAAVSDVEVTWHFDDLETAVAGMLAAGPSVLAVRTSGRDRVREVLERSLAPFRLANGAYRLENRSRYMIATRPAS